VDIVLPSPAGVCLRGRLSSNVRPQQDTVLRHARPEDADAVASVLIESRRAFLPFAPSTHPEHEVRGWVRDVFIPGGSVVVWEEDGTVVGVLSTSADAEACWIDQLYVLPGHTAQGIGGRLLQFAHDSLELPIRLYTFQENSGARRFYERHGYRAIRFTDGQGNEEKCPDVLFELAVPQAEA
jgi:GNAT superfamily N-acetyltransferase